MWVAACAASRAALRSRTTAGALGTRRIAGDSRIEDLGMLPVDRADTGPSDGRRPVRNRLTISVEAVLICAMVRCGEALGRENRREDMALDASEKELIRQSFARLREDFDRHSTFFYDALFRHAPELRPMFRDDLAGQGMKFMTTLNRIIDQLEDPEGIAARYAELGRLHASLGIVATHFDPMGEALIDTMRNAMGEAFTPEHESAWRHSYRDISDTMIRAGGIPRT